MGPQSSGKSTIAKIISFCLWIEKKVCLFRTVDYINTAANFRNVLENYHNLQGYLNENSYIEYTSSYVKIEHKGGNVSGFIMPTGEEEKFTYKRPKILYIPAERNITAISGWTSFKLPDNNLKDFLNDWGVARGLFKDKERLSVSPLHVSYYYDEDTNKDYIGLPDSHTAVALTSASSGIQSSTPMYLLYKAYSDKKYRETLNERTSFEDKQTIDKVISIFSSDIQGDADITLVPYKKHFYVAKPGMEDSVLNALINYTESQSVQSVIEEPELNLFPQTQQALIYELIADAADNDNQLTITTHSPYILFALNNCMMGGLVSSNIPDEEAKSYPSYSSWIHPKNVSIYEIHDGTLKCVQDSDSILEDNYMNQAYKENSDEYLSLLNYYENEE